MKVVTKEMYRFNHFGSNPFSLLQFELSKYGRLPNKPLNLLLLSDDHDDGDG